MAEKISGALIWSLRFRDRDGGFYWHSEPYGGDIYKSYHWPGFASGKSFDETNCLALMRRKAFEIGNLPAPAIEKPAAPHLLDINDAAAISWQGSAGASGYTVERAESKDGPWQIAGRNISDADFQYRPLFNDTGAEIGKNYYYRVTAQNSAGESNPSNIVGPVSVTCKTLVDEMQDLKSFSSTLGALSIEKNEARKFKEDTSRLKGSLGSCVIYKVDGPIVFWEVYSFFPPPGVKAPRPVLDFDLRVSSDGQNFKPAKFSRQNYFTGKGDYNYYLPVLFTCSELPANARYLKIEYMGEAQISRVEIKYEKPSR